MKNEDDLMMVKIKIKKKVKKKDNICFCFCVVGCECVSWMMVILMMKVGLVGGGRKE